jgi:type IV pilus assembly protein PilO
MTLDDLNNIDLADIAGWPYGFKLIIAGVVCAVLVAAGYWFVIKDQRATLESEQRQEQVLKADFMEKKALAINLDAYKQQMIEAEETFGVLLMQLPNRTEVPDLLIDITQAGLARGLQFERFKPGAIVNRDFYAEMPVSVSVTGNYHQIGEFVSEIAALPRIVNLENFTVAPGRSGMLRLDATTKTYHYLEE